MSLPTPTGHPLAIISDDDPILSVAREAVAPETFNAAIAAAVAANPTVAVSKAGEDEAEAARREARSALFPTIDIALNASRSVARRFSNDPNLIVERSRAEGRVDGTITVQETLYDFGAASRRIEAASARILAATADTDRASEGIALRAIGAWYDVFAYGQLIQLGEAYLINTEEFKEAIDRRIEQGVSAPVDRIRVQSAIASAALRLAQYKREYSNAEARYIEIFKASPPSPSRRAPPPDIGAQSRDVVVNSAAKSAVVRAAKAQANAARADAQAVRADTLPSVTVGVDAGRFGLFEPNRNDYDVRARIGVRQRLFGPGSAQADQARARANAASARVLAIEAEAVREADIAWADVNILGSTLASYETNYLAARKTRDAVVERFRVARGTLFDVLDAEDRFFAAATNYLRGLSEYDTARYVLLARSGQLLETMNIAPATPKRGIK